MQCKALLLVCSTLGAFAAFAATPPNTNITNTATANYSVVGTPVSVNGQVTITTAARTPSVIEFLQFVPPGSQQTGAIETSACNAMLDFGYHGRTLCAVVGTRTTRQHRAACSARATIGWRRPTSTTAVKSVFIKLTDLDQNLNPSVAETVITTIRSANGDSETLRLTETGPSTGVFIGYIQSTFGPVVVNDCRLSVAVNTGVNATYTDIVDGSDSTIDGALVDPFGLVFDSTNGNPVNGATVTLINTATGAPAQVFCDDGVTPYPASVISGTSFAACGATISLPAGSYRFPLAAPGTYRLRSVRRPTSVFRQRSRRQRCKPCRVRRFRSSPVRAANTFMSESRSGSADRRAARSFERQPADL